MRLKSWGLLLAALLLLWIVFAFLQSRTFFSRTDGFQRWPGPARKESLILYLFAASDPEFVDNLRFFISQAAEEDDRQRRDYVIILQDYSGDGTEVRHGEIVHGGLEAYSIIHAVGCACRTPCIGSATLLACTP